MKFYSIKHEAIFEDVEKFDYPNRKIGVIAYIENDKGEILLQQRGIKSRDEKGLYETIGGKVDSDDLTFKDAIIREIREEVSAIKYFTKQELLDKIANNYDVLTEKTGPWNFLEKILNNYIK